MENSHEIKKFEDIYFPDEIILLIEFLSSKDFYQFSFMGNTYEIIGKDDVGNFIGKSTNDCVYYLDTELNDCMYIAPTVKIFIKELKLYQKYSKGYEFPANLSDNELEKYAEEFKQQIKELDSNAFGGENTFWAIIAEQMEMELL